MKTAHTALWNQFKSEYKLTDEQLEQFQHYQKLLVAWNKKMNLTAITDPKEIIALHFKDSLEIDKAIDVNAIQSVADVGTGAGFPGLALKIKYPHLALYLVEVNLKKISFLEEVVNQLNLTNVETYTDDWRTFLRHTSGDVDLFCARASLKPEELVRVFKPVSPYKNATLVYWAAESWTPSSTVKKYITSEYAYSINNKQRKLVLMRLSE